MLLLVVVRCQWDPPAAAEKGSDWYVCATLAGGLSGN